MFLNYYSIVLLSMISQGLLLIYSAFDSRFCCSFNISKSLTQGRPSLKQWIKWSLLPSVFKFNSQLLNELMITLFSSVILRFQNSLDYQIHPEKQVSYFLLQCTDAHMKLTIHHKIPLCDIWKVCSRPCWVLEHTWCIPQESKHHLF